MNLNRTRRLTRIDQQKNQKALACLLLTGLVGLSLNLVAGSMSWAAENGWTSPSSEDAPNRNRRTSTRMSSSRYQVSPFSPGSNNLGIDIGQVFLMGDLTRDYADSIGTQLHYTYGVSEMFGFDSSLGYSSHADNKFSLVSLKTGMRMNLAWFDKVIPYATFGLGFYKPAMEITPNNVVSPVLFGLHGGAGVNLEVTNQLFFGASLTLHDMFGTKKQLAEGNIINVDGNYTSFLLNAGVTF